MKTNLVIAIISLTVIYTVNATPQRRQNQNQDESNIPEIISQIFPQPNRGAGAIVTPDPSFVPIPTTSPQMLTINEQNCTCVPYHMCDPNTNTIKNEASDDEVTGFGIIDIRFDAQDCQDVLDVCCIGPATREEPIIPVEPLDKVTQAAGCGVRNVGGIDFQIAGAEVKPFGCKQTY